MTAISINELVLTQDLGERELDCPRHGPYRAQGKRFMVGKGREVWTSCPACRRDLELDERRRKDEALAIARVAAIESMIKQTAIPSRFIGRTLDNFKVENEGQGKALAISREFAENFPAHLRRGSSLIFSGAAGTGKLHLASAILQAILPAHVGAYMTFMAMIRLIRETWHPTSTRRESEVIAELGTIPLLVIDEIGVQYGTEAEHTLLFEVMDRRYRDQRPTILMTNQDKDGFKRFVGDRVYDRMTEVARWVSFDWGSYRTQARKEFQ